MGRGPFQIVLITLIALGLVSATSNRRLLAMATFLLQR